MTKSELIETVAKALRNSGRTCDEDNWSTVMAGEAVAILMQLEVLGMPDKYHRHHEIHEGNCITCYRMGDKEIVE